MRLAMLFPVLLLAGCATSTSSVRREAINPWSWGTEIGMNQGEVVSGQKRTLYLSGQTALDAEGKVVPGQDMRAQFNAAFDNLDTVLKAAGMSRANVVQVTIYATDVKAAADNWGVYMERFAAAGTKPPASLIGVAALAYPGLLIEIEATAVD